MATRSLGTLTLDLVAQIGGYEKGLDKAEREAKKRSAAIEKAFSQSFGIITAGFTAMATAGAAALVALDRQIGFISDYQGLAEKIGDTAENLASLQRAATISGVSLDVVSAASARLTVSLSKTDDETKLVGQAIQALGLNFDQFKKLSPVEQIDAVAKAMDGFADGSEKTAVAIALFGKAGAELIPFFNDLAEGGQRQIRLTNEQIKAADDYKKAQARLRDEFQNFTQQLAVTLIPTLTKVTESFASIAKNQETVSAVTGTLDASIRTAIVLFQTIAVVGANVAFVFKQIGTGIGGMLASLRALGTGDLQGFKTIQRELRADLDESGAALAEFERGIMSIGTSNAGIANAAGFPSAAPDSRSRLDVSGLDQSGSSKAEQALKKSMERRLKIFADAISDESALMQERNRLLEFYNNLGLLSIDDFYSRQKNILAEATQNQVAEYGKQIQALQEFIAKTPKEEDRLDAQLKLTEAIRAQGKVIREAGLATIELGLKQEQAQKAYGDRVDETRAKILELSGQLREASLIRFDAANELFLNQARANGDANTVQQIQQLREYTAAQAELNKLQADQSLILENLSIQEQRIDINRKLGIDTELEGLIKLGDARSAALEQLREQLRLYEALPETMRTPEQISQLEKLRLQIEQLGATADPLKDKFSAIFSDSFSSSLGDFISGTKTASEAFKSFADSIVQQISRIAAQQLVNGLFGSSGGNSSGGGFAGLFGSFFSSIFGGGRAIGGPVSPGNLYRVNEHKNEVFSIGGEDFLMVGQGGTVKQNTGSTERPMQVNNYFTLQGQPTRETQQQLATTTGNAVERARRRNS